MKNALAKSQNDAILCFMGVETQGQAGAVTVKAATSNNNIAQSPCFFGGFAGADLRKHFRHGLVPVFLTPSQSRFFVPVVESRGKREKQKNKEICEVRKVTPKSKKSAVKAGLPLDFSGKCGILCVIGCGNPMSTAEAAAVKGCELLKKSNSVDFFGSAGCALRNVTVDTITTPAGSFFVPGVVIGGKSRKELINRRLTPCKATLQNARNGSPLFSTILFSATTPPGVRPNFSMFRSTTPEQNL